jgi:hypothetical protein
VSSPPCNTEFLSKSQPVLSKKHASILFLYSLASVSQQPTVTPAFLPSLAPPPPPRPTSAIPSPADSPPQARQPHGKSKAEKLREYRQKSGVYYRFLEMLQTSYWSQVDHICPSTFSCEIHYTSCKVYPVNTYASQSPTTQNRTSSYSWRIQSVPSLFSF